MQLMRLFLAAALMAGTTTATGSDAEPCLMCHSKGDFENIDADGIAEALADDGIPAHGSFRALTEEQMAAIVAALTGD